MIDIVLNKVEMALWDATVLLENLHHRMELQGENTDEVDRCVTVLWYLQKALDKAGITDFDRPTDEEIAEEIKGE